ncbi:hypothetical protein BHYA_0013g00400 [Botrytis hyacinthi]|uniref:Uncharacterized protein n=1 Tax=Botrytis hyacinthi TaxID=278943 RepID=A0A4Z1HAH3_9HELO|nr:hypothetical protein BHYA_0013g00400 [Botrytis hyacinthi]
MDPQTSASTIASTSKIPPPIKSTRTSSCANFAPIGAPQPTIMNFRRFWTSHLINLRFVEGERSCEIAKLDREIEQAGQGWALMH